MSQDTFHWQAPARGSDDPTAWPPPEASHGARHAELSPAARTGRAASRRARLPTENRLPTSATHTTRGHTREPRSPSALQMGSDAEAPLVVTASKEPTSVAYPSITVPTPLSRLRASMRATTSRTPTRSRPDPHTGASPRSDVLDASQVPSSGARVRLSPTPAPRPAACAPKWEGNAFSTSNRASP
jgi:hypothetical protein